MRLPVASSPMRRLIVFNSVGVLGFVVQMGALFLLVSILRLNYLVATALAVEAAVLHNFFWHENWTWADRAKTGRDKWFRRLAYFHLANGMVSIFGNLLLMRIFVGSFGMHYAPANLAAIAVCAVLNFIAGDRFVFRASEKYIERRI